MEHTKECLEQMAKREAEIAKYEQDWPNYCKECGGWGGESHVELVGEPGGPNAYQDVWDDCDKCVGEGKCPRCGAELFKDAGEMWNELFQDWLEGMTPCPACGWQFGV